MPLGVEVDLGPRDIVLDGDPAPPSQRGTDPRFSAHTCCGQMVAWIKMSLGMELSLGPGDFVLDGDPASSPKGLEPPILGPRLLRRKFETAAWIKMRLGTEVDLGLRDEVYATLC